MTQGLQAQTAVNGLASTARVRAQAGSALADAAKNSFWQIDFASAKPAGKKAEAADPSASFAHALRQKKREAHKPSEKSPSDEAIDRASEGGRADRKTAKKADERSEAGSAEDAATKETEEAGEAVTESGEGEVTDSAVAAAPTGTIDPDDAAEDVRLTHANPGAVAAQVVQQNVVKADAATETPGEGVATESQQAGDQVGQQAGAVAQAVANSKESVAVQASAQDASKTAAAGAGQQAQSTGEAAASPSNIAELDRLLRRRVPRAEAVRGDGQAEAKVDAAAQGISGAEQAVRAEAVAASSTKARTQNTSESEAAELPETVSPATKPPEPASVGAPEARRPSNEEPPTPFRPAVESKPTEQVSVNAAERVVASPVAQARPVESTNVQSADEVVAAPIDGVQPAAPSGPTSDASRTLQHVHTAGSAMRSEAQASVQAPAPQEAAAQFQKALQAQVERGIAMAMQQATLATGAGDVAMGTGGVVLRLHPAHLGQLKVQLKIEPAGKGGGSGGVRARFEASSGKAKAILDGSMDTLRSALEERGLRVDEVVVAQSPRMPERELGLPLPGGHADAGHAGAGFAGSGDLPGHGAPETGGVPGDERRAAAETGGAELDGGGFAERPVTLGGLPWAVGPDGQIRVDALV